MPEGGLQGGILADDHAAGVAMHTRVCGARAHACVLEGGADDGDSRRVKEAGAHIRRFLGHAQVSPLQAEEPAEGDIQGDRVHRGQQPSPPEGMVLAGPLAFTGNDAVHEIQRRREPAQVERIPAVVGRAIPLKVKAIAHRHDAHPVLAGAGDGVDEVRLCLRQIDDHIGALHDLGRGHIPQFTGIFAKIVHLLGNLIQVDQVRPGLLHRLRHPGERHHLAAALGMPGRLGDPYFFRSRAEAETDERAHEAR